MSARSFAFEAAVPDTRLERFPTIEAAGHAGSAPAIQAGGGAPVRPQIRCCQRIGSTAFLAGQPSSPAAGAFEALPALLGGLSVGQPDSTVGCHFRRTAPQPIPHEPRAFLRASQRDTFTAHAMGAPAVLCSTAGLLRVQFQLSNLPELTTGSVSR